jgi:hypothetical protein
LRHGATLRPDAPPLSPAHPAAAPASALTVRLADLLTHFGGEFPTVPRQRANDLVIAMVTTERLAGPYPTRRLGCSSSCKVRRHCSSPDVPSPVPLPKRRMPAPVRRGPRRATTAKRLLTDALAQIGAVALARAAGTSVEHIERWSSPAYKMTTAERAALVIAVITTTSPASGLFREALNLRGQVCAAMDYEAGVTLRGPGPARAGF